MLAKSRFRLARSFASVPPCRTLARKAPPGFKTSRANSAATSTSAMILRWSVRRHVREHDVGFPSQHGLQLLRRARVEKVEMQKLDAGDRAHVEAIDGDDAAASLPRPYPFRRHLAPAARGRAKIDDPRAGLEHMVLVVDLGELEGRPRAIARVLGTRDIRII